MIISPFKKQFLFFLYILTIYASAEQEHTTYQQVSDLCNQAKNQILAHDYTEAISNLKRALDIDPKNIRAHFYLANALFCSQQYADALSYYQKTADFLPNNADIYCNLGICANMLEKTSNAITYFEKAINLDPHCTLAYLQLIGSLEKSDQLKKAFTTCKKFLSLQPSHREALLSAGSLAKRLEQFEDAEWYYRTVYNQNTDDFQAIIELAAVLVTLEEYEEALTLYRKALTIKPESISVFYNLGFTLKKLGYLDEAIAIYKQVIREKPDYALAHFSLGLAYLTQGNFKDGLPEYEWRWKAYNETPRIIPAPQWDGSSVQGKKMYIYAEQGYGDTFEYVRYLQKLKNDGAYIIFCPQNALIPLIKLCPYIDEVVSSQQAIPSCDYQAPLMTLPLLYDTRLETIPAKIPYLYADKTLIKEWATYFAQKTPQKIYKVGICWHGNSQYKDISLRRAVAQKSCPLALFKMLADIPNVQLYSLQKVSGLDELNTVDHTFLHLFPDTIDSAHGRFMDTAAIIEQLDLVITVDTSIAHLAAALGVETWNLLPEPADWRWMLTRSDTPWYPNMRLFRQSARGDWHSIMQEVHSALIEKIKEEKTKTVSIEPPQQQIIIQVHNYITELHNRALTGEQIEEKLLAAYEIKKDLSLMHGAFS